MMTKIYETAYDVVVCPRSYCTDYSHRSHHYSRPLIRMLSLTSSVLQAVRPERPTLYNQETKKFGIVAQPHKAWMVWQRLRSQPWFSRAWIVQEVSVNRNVKLIHNGIWYDFKDILAANTVVAGEAVAAGQRDTWDGRLNLHSIACSRQEAATARQPPLTLLTMFRNFQATDSKHKIYAFYGMAADCDSAPAVDYTQPVETRYAEYFIGIGKGFQVLAQAGSNRAVLDLPSWVPDWTVGDGFVRRFDSCYVTEVRPRPFEAGKNLQGTVRLGSSGKTVLLKGILFDRIVEATAPISVLGKGSYAGSAVARHFLDSLETASDLLARSPSSIYPDY